jgi:hypothetical protein
LVPLVPTNSIVPKEFLLKLTGMGGRSRLNAVWLRQTEVVFSEECPFFSFFGPDSISSDSGINAFRRGFQKVP